MGLVVGEGEEVTVEVVEGEAGDLVGIEVEEAAAGGEGGPGEEGSWAFGQGNIMLPLLYENAELYCGELRIYPN